MRVGWTLFALVLWLAAMLLALATVAEAQEGCGERDRIALHLYEAMDMRLVSWGLTARGNMHELFMDSDGHWAVVSTSPNRCSRLISAPTHHLERLNPPPMGGLLRRADPS